MKIPELDKSDSQSQTHTLVRSVFFSSVIAKSIAGLDRGLFLEGSIKNNCAKSLCIKKPEVNILCACAVLRNSLSRWLYEALFEETHPVLSIDVFCRTVWWRKSWIILVCWIHYCTDWPTPTHAQNLALTSSRACHVTLSHLTPFYLLARVGFHVSKTKKALFFLI